MVKKTNNRRPLNSSPEFLIRLKKLQGKIKERCGEEPSLTELTDEITHSPSFDKIEEEIMDGKLPGTNFKIKFDGKIE